MTTAELLLQDFDPEIANTRRVLERVPEDKTDFKCHNKSMPFGRLAVHVSTLPRLGITVLTTPGLDLATVEWPDMTFVSRDKLLADFDALSAEARAALASLSDAQLAESLPPDVRAGADLPYDFRTERTIYTRFGDWFAWLCVLVSAILLASTFWKGNVTSDTLPIPVDFLASPISAVPDAVTSRSLL